MTTTRRHLFPLLLLGLLLQSGHPQQARQEQRSLLLPEVLELYRANGEDLVYTYNELEQYAVVLPGNDLPSLEQLLLNTPFRLIERHGKKHVIRPARYVISGRVCTEDDLPLPDANITIRGTSLGTTTDSSGHFRLLHDLPRPVRLDIGYIGFRDTSLVLVHRNALSDSLWLANIPLNTEVFEAGPVLTEAQLGKGFTENDNFEDLPDWGEVSPALLSMTYIEEDASADAFHVFKTGTIRLSDNLQIVTSIRVRSKIFNSAGTRLARVEIPYWHEDNLKNLRGITVLSNGNKYDLPEKAVQSRKDGATNITSFELPEVQPGAVVEYEYELYSRYLMDIEPWRFSDDYFVQLSRLTAKFGGGFRYAVQYQNFEYLPPSIINNLKYRETAAATTWQLSNLQPESALPWLNRATNYAPALQFGFLQFSGEIILGSWEHLIDRSNSNSDLAKLVDPTNSTRAASVFPSQAGKPIAVDRSNQGTLWRIRQNQLLTRDLQQRTNIDLTPITKISNKLHLPVKRQHGFFYQYATRLREGISGEVENALLIDQQKNGENGLLASSPLLDQKLGFSQGKLQVDHRSTGPAAANNDLPNAYRGEFFFDNPRLIFANGSKLYRSIQQPLQGSKRVLKRIVNKDADPQEALSQIYAFVRDEFKTIDRGLPVADRSLNDVLRYRKGSEVEKNLVFIRLLRSAGIQADPILLNTGAPVVPTQLAAAITQFDFIIARVQLAGQAYYIDTNDRAMPWFLPAEEKWSEQGLVISDEQAELILLKQPAELNLVRGATNVVVDSSGQVSASSQLDFNGYPALRWQRRLAGLDEFLQERRVAAWLQTRLSDWDCDVEAVQSDQSSLADLRFSVNYEASNYIESRRQRRHPLSWRCRSRPSSRTIHLQIINATCQ